MGVLRQWKWATLQWEEVQSGQNQYVHVRNHVILKKKKIYTCMHEEIDPSAALLQAVFSHYFSVSAGFDTFTTSIVFFIYLIPLRPGKIAVKTPTISLRTRTSIRIFTQQICCVQIILFNLCIFPIPAQCVWSTSLMGSRACLKGLQALQSERLTCSGSDVTSAIQGIRCHFL